MGTNTLSNKYNCQCCWQIGSLLTKKKTELLLTNNDSAINNPFKRIQIHEQNSQKYRILLHKKHRNDMYYTVPNLFNNLSRTILSNK